MNTPLPLPPAFQKRMRSLLGTAAEELFTALEHPPLTGLRVNTLKLSPERFRALTPWPLTPVPWCPSGFLLPGEARPGKHPYHAAGLYYLQEPSAMAVAEALAPEPGERALDLAAAPGGKATQLAALMKGSGLLVANEVNRGRTKALTENMERWGAKGVLITSEAVAQLAGAWGPVFDRVLLDAPCSGEGMFRKSEDALAMWSEANVRGCAARQDKLLGEAVQLVKPGGRLVYSTCTFAPEEDEAVIARFLAAHRDFDLEPLSLAGAAPGRSDWLPTELHNPDLHKTARFWPHRAPGEGHFVARLRRTDGPEVRLAREDVKPIPKQVGALWQDFVSATLPADPAEGATLTRYGDHLYAVPEDAPTLRGLKTVRAGFWLGTLKKNRLEPSHSLALALRPSEVRGARTLELSPEDERLKRYLQGDVLEEPGEDGWLLVTVAGFPIAWGRRARGVVKNAYPKGLRTVAR